MIRSRPVYLLIRSDALTTAFNPQHVFAPFLPGAAPDTYREDITRRLFERRYPGVAASALYTASTLRSGLRDRVAMDLADEARLLSAAVSDPLAAGDADAVKDYIVYSESLTHGRFSVDRVAVPPADALDRDEACLDEVCDDPLGCALGDADHLRDVSCPHVFVPGDTEQDLSVVGHEPPGLAVHPFRQEWSGP